MRDLHGAGLRSGAAVHVHGRGEDKTSPLDQGLDLETGFAGDTSANVTTSTLEV